MEVSRSRLVLRAGELSRRESVCCDSWLISSSIVSPGVWIWDIDMTLRLSGGDNVFCCGVGVGLCVVLLLTFVGVGDKGGWEGVMCVSLCS